jgi:putative aminopeptidase FrvX
LDIRKCLENFSCLCAPSGFEKELSEYAVQLMKPFMDESYVDRFGNAVGILRCGKPNARRLLFIAHLDEIGLIVTGAEDGFLHFTTIGGVDPRMLPDRELTLLTEPPVFGLVACLPPHVLSSEEMDQSIPIPDLRIDVGMTQEEAEKRIPVGTPATFRGGCFSLGKELFCGKALDDRSCFLSLLLAVELLKGKILDCDLYILGSTREEVNSGGASVGAFSIKPDACVVVDVTHAETPDGGPKNRDCCLGAGPAVAVGPNTAKWMTRRLFEKAAGRNIPIQTEVMEGNTYTDGWRTQIAREGIPTSIVSLPMRYMHTPIETISIKDMEWIAELLAAFAEDPGWEVDASC